MQYISTASNPMLSVITIVRNGMPYIEQTIKSVLSQNYRELEYILIDGSSTDGTLDVIKSHSKGITKWISEKDDGIADAFNKGLSLATGDYLMFLNSDDALTDKDVMGLVAKKIVESNYPALLYGDCNVLDRRSGEVLYRASIDVTHKELLRGKMIPQPSLFTHRSYFEKYGVFDPNFKIAMDYEWLLRGGLKERIVHVPLLVSNVRTGGISTQNQSQVVDEIISALKMNGYLSSTWAELQTRGYFIARFLTKVLLKSLGLYKGFVYLRHKGASLTHDALENGSRDQR